MKNIVLLLPFFVVFPFRIFPLCFSVQVFTALTGATATTWSRATEVQCEADWARVTSSTSDSPANPLARTAPSANGCLSCILNICVELWRKRRLLKVLIPSCKNTCKIPVKKSYLVLKILKVQQLSAEIAPVCIILHYYSCIILIRI